MLLVLSRLTFAVEPANPPVLSFRLVHPESQWAAVNNLFRGSRAPTPPLRRGMETCDRECRPEQVDRGDDLRL